MLPGLLENRLISFSSTRNEYYLGMQEIRNECDLRMQNLSSLGRGNQGLEP